MIIAYLFSEHGDKFYLKELDRMHVRQYLTKERKDAMLLADDSIDAANLFRIGYEVEYIVDGEEGK